MIGEDCRQSQGGLATRPLSQSLAHPKPVSVQTGKDPDLKRPTANGAAMQCRGASAASSPESRLRNRLLDRR